MGDRPMPIRTKRCSSLATGAKLRSGASALALALAFVASVHSAGAKGTFSTFRVNGSSVTEAVAINAGGVVTGNWRDASRINEGFVRAADGTITSFAPEGSIETLPTCINRRGVAAGFYDRSSGPVYGFWRKAGG